MKESIQSKPKAYLYLRVATANQFDDAVQQQEKQLREYSERLGYSVVGKSILCGSAADTLEELRRLAIDREYRGDASIILATEPTRIVRDMTSLFGVTHALSLAKIHVEFADGTGDITERLGLLSAMNIEKLEVDDSFLLDDDALFVQTM